MKKQSILATLLTGITLATTLIPGIKVVANKQEVPASVETAEVDSAETQPTDATTSTLGEERTIQEESEPINAEVLNGAIVIYRDQNKNGLQDADEAGVSGVTITIRNQANEIVVQSETDEQGHLNFSQLAEGDYVLELTRPAGLVLAQPLQEGVTIDKDVIRVTLTVDGVYRLKSLAFYEVYGDVVAHYVDETGKQIASPTPIVTNQPIDTSYMSDDFQKESIRFAETTYSLVGIAETGASGELKKDQSGKIAVTEITAPVTGKVTEGQTEITYVYRKKDDESAKIKGVPQSNGQTVIVATNPYVQHWSGKDAAHHNVFSQRYGITAEQLDGLISHLAGKAGGVQTRVTGEKLLHWQEISGIDARVLMAYAIQDSSLGFVEAGEDMDKPTIWLHGSEKANATDEEHVMALAAFLRREKNETLANQEKKYQTYLKDAAKYHQEKDGALYFNDQSAKARVKFLEDVDQWIDEHGGTPNQPEVPVTVTASAAELFLTLPKGFSLSKTIDTRNYVTQSYPWGQCTWYVFNRAAELGISFDPYMGNGGDWKDKPGYEITHQPQVGAAVSFAAGEVGSDPIYGHVAIVESIAEDGSVLVSESNVQGLGVISYRVFSATEATQLAYVLGH